MLPKNINIYTLTIIDIVYDLESVPSHSVIGPDWQSWGCCHKSWQNNRQSGNKVLTTSMEKNYARVIVYKLNYKDYRKCGAIVSQNSFDFFQLKPENFVTFAKVWKRVKQYQSSWD